MLADGGFEDTVSVDVLAAPYQCEAVPSRGGSNGNITGDAGEGLMQDFVRLHMMSILQPFAERVNELQSELQRIGDSADSLDQIVERHEMKLADHDTQLMSLHSSTSEVSERTEKLQAEITAAKRERNRIEGNHEMTKASLIRTKESFTELEAVLQTLRESWSRTDEKLIAVESSVPETEKRLSEQFEVRLNKQGKACKELGEKQIEMGKTCEHARTMAEKAGAAIKKLAGHHEAQRQEDTNSLLAVSERTKALEAKADSSDKDLQRCLGDLKAAQREMEHIKTWSGRISELDTLAEKQAETWASLDSSYKRLQKLEATVGQLSEDGETDRKLQASTFSGFEQKLSKCLVDSAKWMEIQKAQSEMLSHASRRVDELEGNSSRLASFVETAQTEIRNLVTWQRNAVSSLDGHTGALEDLRKGLGKTQEGLQGSVAALQALRGDVGNSREALTRLSARVDQCYKFFNGFGKGLQDTSRQVLNQEGGFLHPKSSSQPPPGGPLAPMLPVLPPHPQMPKTPRAAPGHLAGHPGPATPRKPKPHPHPHPS